VTGSGAESPARSQERVKLGVGDLEPGKRRKHKQAPGCTSAENEPRGWKILNQEKNARVDRGLSGCSLGFTGREKRKVLNVRGTSRRGGRKKKKRESGLGSESHRVQPSNERLFQGRSGEDAAKKSKRKTTKKV